LFKNWVTFNSSAISVFILYCQCVCWCFSHILVVHERCCYSSCDSRFNGAVLTI
jgi:hypothetical protein